MLNLKYGSNSLFVLFSLTLLAGAFGLVRDLVAYASDWNNNNASQVLMVPFITATLIYLNRKKIFNRIQHSVVPGALLMVAGGALFLLAKTKDVNLEMGDHLALLLFPLLLVWWGGFVCFYGVPSFKAALFPLLFMTFALPIPSFVMNAAIHFLQHTSADVAYVILRLTGMPIYKEDVLLFLPNLTVEVAPECSGIRSGISLLILSLLAGNVALGSWQRKLAFVLAAIPILIFKNALRISTLSYLAVHVDQRILTSRLHQEGGIPFFVVGLLLMYPVLRFLIRGEARVSPRQPVTQEVSL
jgi:exosortase